MSDSDAKKSIGGSLEPQCKDCWIGEKFKGVCCGYPNVDMAMICCKTCGHKCPDIRLEFNSRGYPHTA